MKKFRRIIGILSGILFAVGVIATMIGFSMGGGRVVAQDALNGRLTIGSNYFYEEDWEDLDMEDMITLSDGKTQVDACEVKALKCYGRKCEYEFVVWSEPYYEIQGLSNTDQIKFRLKNQVLTVCTTESAWIFGEEKGKTKVQVMVPSNYRLDEMLIRISAGKVSSVNRDANSIDIGELNVNLGAGEGTFDRIGAENATFKIGAGSAKIQYADFRNCTLQVGMGTLDVDGNVYGNLGIDCGMGEIDVCLSQLKSEFNYNVKVGLGDVQIGAEHYKNISDSSFANGAEKTMDIQCGMGSIDISFFGE